MGRLLDGLLLAAVLAEVKTLIPPWTFIPLITYENGAGFKLETWSWVSSMPSSDFCLSFWVYVNTETVFPSFILGISYGSNGSNEKLLYWTLDNKLEWHPTPFSFDGSPLVVSRTTYPKKLWFHFVLTSDKTSLCEIITLRFGSQNKRCQTPTVSLDSTSKIMAPITYDTFRVKSR